MVLFVPSSSLLVFLAIIIIIDCTLHNIHPITIVSAQEYPNPLYRVEQFNSSVSFRQNVCSRHQPQYLGTGGHRDNINNNGVHDGIEYALEGLELRTILRESPFLHLDSDGKINEDYPGLAAVLMDEVARRAKFTWRNSFSTFTVDNLGGKTWTDMLLWTTHVYDISAADWDNTLERFKAGIAYPVGWYDSSLILIGKKNTEAEELFDPWSWLAPFDYSVWALIFVTIIASGFIYMFLDFVDPYSDKRQLKSKPVESVYLSAMGFAGHMEFEPRTHPARLFTFSLAMWALLMSAAYTANLASFLVVRNVPAPPIESVEEAVRLGEGICVWEGTGMVAILQKDHPNARLIQKEQEEDTYKGVLDGDCKVAVAYVSSWHDFERDAKVNGECKLVWVGRKYKDIPAGFATVSDSGTKCTSLIRDVLNIHMAGMKQDGFIDQAWTEHLRRTASVDCSAPPSEQESSTGQRQRSRRYLKGGGGAAAAAASNGGSGVSLDAQTLNVKNMGGIFLMHGGFSVIAIVFALIHRWAGLQARRDEERRKKNLRLHLKRSKASKALRLEKDPSERCNKLMDVMNEFGSDDGDRFFAAATTEGDDDSDIVDVNGNNNDDDDDDDDFFNSFRTNRKKNVRFEADNSLREHKDDIGDIKASMRRLEKQMAALTSMVTTSSSNDKFHAGNYPPPSIVRMDGSVQTTESPSVEMPTNDS